MERQGRAHGLDTVTWLMWSAQQRREAFITKYQPRTSPSSQSIWTKAEVATEPVQDVWTLVRYNGETEYAWPGSDSEVSAGYCERFGYLVTAAPWNSKDAHGVWKEKDPRIEEAPPSLTSIRITKRRPPRNRRG